MDIGLRESNSFAAPTLPYTMEVLVNPRLETPTGKDTRNALGDDHGVLTTAGISCRPASGQLRLLWR